VLAACNEVPERLLKLSRGLPAWAAILSSTVVGFHGVIAAAARRTASSSSYSTFAAGSGLVVANLPPGGADFAGMYQAVAPGRLNTEKC
jgi:hypothetical protein